VQVSPIEPTATPAAPAYVIRFTYAIDTALDAGRLFAARSLGLYRLAFGVGLLVGAILILYDPSVGLPIVAFCAIMLLLTQFPVINRLLGRRRLRSLLGRTMELALRDDGIAWVGPLSSGHIPWSSVTEVRANSRTVLFMGDRLVLVYAPAASFASVDEQSAVIEYARRRIAATRTGGVAR
jgi:hypothetical protein